MAFSSLYIGATGLTAHAQGMSVVSNNLANVSTAGYKGADILFQDLMSQQMATGSNKRGDAATLVSQKGLGVGVSGIKTSFIQGGLEGTTEVTDLAIGGNGFFSVINPDDGAVHYTRAGQFRFDNQGYLLSPHGYRLQGSDVDRVTRAVGSAGDIQLPFAEEEVEGQTVPVVRSEPLATTEVTLAANLDVSEGDYYTDAANPFFSMATAWNGLNSDPLGESFQGYSTTIGLYDAAGARHDVTLYMDKVGDGSLTGENGANTYWEFVLGMDPTEDAGTLAGTSGAGLIGYGTMTFNQYGGVIGQTAYTPTGLTLSNSALSTFNANGIPQFEITFAGAAGAAGTAQTVAFDFGLTSSNASWNANTAATAAAVGTDVDNLGNMGGLAVDTSSFTNYAQGSATLFADQNGYATGYLQALSVDTDGYLEGLFSNGQTEALYRINLYRFNSEHGLRRDGGNLFSATSDSGTAIEGLPTEGGRGVIYQNSLEQSNVDMADEFTRLILTQRGFQSNTKVITTSDSILQTAIQIKR